jgi:hypothetical protein
MLTLVRRQGREEGSDAVHRVTWTGTAHVFGAHVVPCTTCMRYLYRICSIVAALITLYPTPHLNAVLTNSKCYKAESTVGRLIRLDALSMTTPMYT